MDTVIALSRLKSGRSAENRSSMLPSSSAVKQSTVLFSPRVKRHLPSVFSFIIESPRPRPSPLVELPSLNGSEDMGAFPSSSVITLTLPFSTAILTEIKEAPASMLFITASSIRAAVSCIRRIYRVFPVSGSW